MEEILKGFIDRDGQKHNLLTESVLVEALKGRISAVQEASIIAVLDESGIIDSVECYVEDELTELSEFDDFTGTVRLVNLVVEDSDENEILNQLGYYISYRTSAAGGRKKVSQKIVSGENIVSRTGVIGPQAPGWGSWEYQPSKTGVIEEDGKLPAESGAVYTALSKKINNTPILLSITKDDEEEYPYQVTSAGKELINNFFKIASIGAIYPCLLSVYDGGYHEEVFGFTKIDEIGQDEYSITIFVQEFKCSLSFQYLVDDINPSSYGWKISNIDISQIFS